MHNFYVEHNPYDASPHHVIWVNGLTYTTYALTESELKGVYEQLGEYIKTLPTPHPHAELMKQYAEDAATRQDPWVLWEFNDTGIGWYDLSKHPSWKSNCKYRRKEIK